MAIENLYFSARVMNCAAILDLFRDFGYRSAPHAQHFRQVLLCQIDGIASSRISRLQEPPAKAGLDEVNGVASCVNSSLGQQDFVVAHAEVSKGDAISRRLPKSA